MSQRAKSRAFMRFILKKCVTCGACGSSHTIQQSGLEILDAERGMGVYGYDCPKCGSTLLGAFGPRFFVEEMLSHVDEVFSGSSGPPPVIEIIRDVQVRDEALH